MQEICLDKTKQQLAVEGWLSPLVILHQVFLFSIKDHTVEVPPPWCELIILPSCNIVLRFTCTHLCLVDTLPLQRTFHPGEQFGIVWKLLSDYRLFLCVHSLLTVPDILWPNLFLPLEHNRDCLTAAILMTEEWFYGTFTRCHNPALQ